MTCKLCSGSSLTRSPIANVAERCDCMRGRVVHVLTYTCGTDRNLHCMICDPLRRAAPVEPTQHIVLTRKAWLPDGTFGHWDPAKRGGVLAYAPERAAICTSCVSGMAILLGAWTKGERREVANAAPHMNDPKGLVIT